ncbi:MAG: 6-carboxytetrahydropterin synthase [Phycisphaerae bacterium]|nr:6-carboxytetrahydropterin synthase [Phycisphaerae bacterium]
MFTIFLESSFTAQHQLTFSGGTQEPLHNHEWKVCVAVSAEKLNNEDLVMDFEELKLLLERTLQDFRSQRLETNPLFEQRNASAENLAAILYQQIEPKLPDTVHLDFVEVTEAAGCRARFSV